MLDPRNAKKHYQSFLTKKNTKLVKQSEIITYQPNTFKNPNIVDIKSVITEHPKIIQHYIRQGSNSSFYSDTKKGKIFLNEKNVKITKRAHAFKCYASTYNVEIFSSFNPELQLKDSESPVKSKLVDLFSKLRGLKFVTTSVLLFKKTKQGMTTFIQAQKQK